MESRGEARTFLESGRARPRKRQTGLERLREASRGFEGPRGASRGPEIRGVVWRAPRRGPR
eukprot:466494-Alexandrium_andersonii.AAC.1